MDSTLAGAGALFLLLVALGGEAVFGEMRWLFARLPHPRRLVGETVDGLERRLNRALRGPRARLIRGLLVVLAITALAIAAGILIELLVRHVRLLWPLELLLVASLLAQRGPHDRAARAARLIADGGVVSAQEALRPLAGLGPRGLEGLDRAGTVREGALALARALVHGVVAPCFWFVLLGLPGLLVQQAVLVMAVRLGRGPSDDPAGDTRYRDFGLVARRLDDALTLLPALLAALVIAAASLFVPRARPLQALAAIRPEPSGDLRGRGPARAPARVMVAALGLDAAAGAAELDRARMLFTVACLINAGAIAALVLLLLSL